jgi:polar amino acid transport system substrate-binding protein
VSKLNRRQLILFSVERILTVISLFATSQKVIAKENSLISTDNNLNFKKQDYLLKSDELLISYPSQDQYPFFYTKEGETIGMDVDLAKSFAKSLNLKLKIDRSVFTTNEVVDLVRDKKIDAAFYITPTINRTLKVSFSKPYFSSPHSLIVNRVEFAKFSKVETIEKTIQNYTGTIAVTAGSVWEELAHRNFPKATVVKFKTWDENIEAVKLGKVICAYRNEFFVRKVLKTDPSLALILRAISFNDLFDYESIAIHHDNKQLKELFDLFVSQKSGQLNIEDLIKQL